MIYLAITLFIMLIFTVEIFRSVKTSNPSLYGEFGVIGNIITFIVLYIVSPLYIIGLITSLMPCLIKIIKARLRITGH